MRKYEPFNEDIRYRNLFKLRGQDLKFSLRRDSLATFCLETGSSMSKFLQFSVEPSVVQPEQRPCDAHPCGTNAQCRQQGQAVSCICPADYIGDPYSACRPECVLNDDCPRDQSCVRNKCVNPCDGTCGINAECRVSNHVPVCTCLTGHTGDPYGACRPIPVIRKHSFSC